MICTLLFLYTHSLIEVDVCTSMSLFSFYIWFVCLFTCRVKRVSQDLLSQQMDP